MTAAEAPWHLEDRPARTWLILAGYVHRYLMSVVGLLVVAQVDDDLARACFWPVIALCTYTTIVAYRAVVPSGGGQRYLSSTPFLFFDVGIAAAANLYASLHTSNGQYLVQGADVFWEYYVGTIVVWTAIRGWRTGTLIAVSGLAVGILSLPITSTPLTLNGSYQALGRIGWLIGAVLVPATIIRWSHQGEGLATSEGKRAGQAAQKSWRLRRMHDTVAQVLSRVLLVSEDTSSQGPQAQRTLNALHAVTTDCLPHLEDSLERETDVEEALDYYLLPLKTEFADLTIDLTIDPHRPNQVPGLVASGIAGICAAALNNVRRHSGTTDAAITIRVEPKSVFVEITDAGVGFDKALTPEGWGTTHAFRGRVAELGGESNIESSAGNGTRASFTVPLKTPQGSRVAVQPPSGDHDAKDVNEPNSWFAYPALAYRLILTPVQVMLGLSTFRDVVPNALWLVVALVLIADVYLLARFKKPHIQKFLHSPWTLFLDFALIAGINVWQASAMPSGELFVPGAQVFWPYFFGVGILWTALKGARAGLLVVLLTASVEAWLAAWKGPHDDPFLLVAGTSSQVGQVLVGVVVATIILTQAERELQQAHEAGARAGVELESASTLIDFHRSAINSIRTIHDITSDPEVENPNATLIHVRGIALESSAAVRAVLDGIDTAPADRAQRRLLEVIAIAQRAGLKVDFVADGRTTADHEATTALERAVRWALQNVIENSDAAHAILRLRNREGSVEAVIRDRGNRTTNTPHTEEPAFLAAADAVTAVGGDVDVKEMGEGTRVAIRVPASAAQTETNWPTAMHARSAKP